MGWRCKEHKKAYMKRRTQRYAHEGRKLEQRVVEILQEMCEKGEIDSFCHHKPNSFEDTQGKDFSVIKEGKKRSFGVTISHRSQRRSSLKHILVTQFCFPFGIKDETIRKKILELFFDIDI